VTTADGSISGTDAAWSETDRQFMREALTEAHAAADFDEVPVGAVVVYEHEIVARAGNRTLRDNDPTAHAEIVALRAAAAALGNHRLTGATLYVTLEPCPMCFAALSHARIDRVVFGAYDEKAGSAGSAIDMTASPALNYHVEVNGGLMADACAEPLVAFFESRR